MEIIALEKPYGGVWSSEEEEKIKSLLVNSYVIERLRSFPERLIIMNPPPNSSIRDIDRVLGHTNYSIKVVKDRDRWLRS